MCEWARIEKKFSRFYIHSSTKFVLNEIKFVLFKDCQKRVITTLFVFIPSLLQGTFSLSERRHRPNFVKPVVNFLINISVTVFKRELKQWRKKTPCYPGRNDD